MFGVNDQYFMVASSIYILVYVLYKTIWLLPKSTFTSTTRIYDSVKVLISEEVPRVKYDFLIREREGACFGSRPAKIFTLAFKFRAKYFHKS